MVAGEANRLVWGQLAVPNRIIKLRPDRLGTYIAQSSLASRAGASNMPASDDNLHSEA